MKNLFTQEIDFPKQNASDFNFESDDTVTQAAVKAFGIKYLYPWQRIVIANILDSAIDKENKNEFIEEDLLYNGKQIVLLPTGAGKSLCFLTPALLLKGPTLVLYPLLALMADQKRRMDQSGLNCVVFRGGQSIQEREENFNKIKNGAKIILANPEVLQNPYLIKKLASCNISHIAIDEAHCICEWGNTFRPAYLTLGTIIKTLNVKTVTAFTATASPQVLESISKILFDGQANIVRSDSDRPNIHYYVHNAFAKKRAAFKLAIKSPKPLIIFCGTRKHAEDMSRELKAFYDEDKVRFYHAGMEKKEKTKTEKWFFPKEDAILCATCAFGMGVDKKDIRNVIHLDCPSTAEAYIQEAGRGGRDGKIANGILLWNQNDSLKTQKYSLTSRQRVMKTFAESKSCRRQILLTALEGKSYFEKEELTFCDGCDICERKSPAPFAEDASIVLDFIKKNTRRFKKDELLFRLTEELNKKDISEFGINIWETDDVNEILEQLEQLKLIKKCRWPWKGLYTSSYSSTSEAATSSS